MYLVKTDANGDTLWTRTYGGLSSDDASCVQLTTDGGYIIGGKTFSYGAGSADMYMVKTDSNGDTLWTRTYGGALADLGEELRQTTDGGFIIAGRTESFGAGEKDFYLVKTDAMGDTLWTSTYGGFNYEYCNSVQQTTDGNFIALGYTGSFGSGLSDFYLVRIAGKSTPEIVSIELTPHDPPVIVPRGGSFTYSGSLTNITSESQIVDVWIMTDVPGVGMIGPLRLLNDIPLSPYQVRTAPNVRQDIPELAPLGIYYYIGYCGEYPQTIFDSSSFEFEVIP
jgi:regulation of enolase protein 1 (concanavalin A-like superfamily)